MLAGRITDRHHRTAYRNELPPDQMPKQARSASALAYAAPRSCSTEAKHCTNSITSWTNAVKVKTQFQCSCTGTTPYQSNTNTSRTSSSPLVQHAVHEPHPACVAVRLQDLRAQPQECKSSHCRQQHITTTCTMLPSRPLAVDPIATS